MIEFSFGFGKKKSWFSTHMPIALDVDSTNILKCDIDMYVI